ncbi:energy transducer TonB [Novosphingobium sp.]|uniref:energy transducer TonB n=1 Tax=Novosphingobium sp. TaxID=1874826 RepID=UPI003BADAD85
MAYLTPHNEHGINRRRIVALGAVGAVHGVMALVLLTGFAGGMIQEFKRKTLQTWNYMPPPPAPSPEPDVKPAPHPRDTTSKPDPIPQIPPMGDPGFHIDPGPLPPIGSELGGGTLPPLPPPTPSPSFTPRLAKPLGAPGKWVSDADYPAGALHRGQQGASTFELTIGPDGRVRDCRITRSSGSADLDAATCAKVSERASFTPARDEHGDLVAGRYSGVIRWRIPE